MLLTGTFPRTLDEKQRVALPKPLRTAFGEAAENLHIAPGIDQCLAIYAEAEFQKMAARIQKARTAGKEVRAFSRLFYANADRVELDSQGRFRIPLDLAKWANLQNEVVLVGVGDHAEVWDVQLWNTYNTQYKSNFDQLSEAALDRTRADS